MDVLDKLRQDCRDNPCFETRYSLASALLKAGADIKNAALKFTYLSEAAELLDKNYKEDPRYETRRHLAVIYKNLGEATDKGNEFHGLSKRTDFYIKAAELYEINLTEKPSFEARTSLSRLYRSIIFVTDTTKPGAYSFIKQLYLKKLPLDEANYIEKQDKDTFAMLANTYYSLAEAILSENASDAIAEAEKWLMTDLRHRDKYFAEHPGSHYAKMTLVHAYHRLSQLEKRKGTPEGNERSSMWQKKITATINKPLKKDY